MDQFEDVPTDRTRNALNGAVAAPTVTTFDEVGLHRFTDAAWLLQVPEADLVAGIRDLIGCMVNQRSWYHDTNGLMVEWNSAAARYTTSLPNIARRETDVLSFRVAQDVGVNPAGPQNFRVRLTDSKNQHATLRVSDFATIPSPRRVERNVVMGQGTPTQHTIVIDFTKSVFKTVRLPLRSFRQANPKLELGSLVSITFEFSERVPGRLGFDDLEFST